MYWKNSLAFTYFPYVGQKQFREKIWWWNREIDLMLRRKTLIQQAQEQVLKPTPLSSSSSSSSGSNSSCSFALHQNSVYQGLYSWRAVLQHPISGWLVLPNSAYNKRKQKVDNEHALCLHCFWVQSSASGGLICYYLIAGKRNVS
jgi:hypothetical protein